MEKLIQVLQKSVDKHGLNEPVTLGHLLNIVKLVHKLELAEEERKEEDHEDALNSLYPHGDSCSWPDNGGKIWG